MPKGIKGQELNAALIYFSYLRNYVDIFEDGVTKKSRGGRSEIFGGVGGGAILTLKTPHPAHTHTHTRGLYETIIDLHKSPP